MCKNNILDYVSFIGKIKLKRRKKWVVGVWVVNLREG